MLEFLRQASQKQLSEQNRNPKRRTSNQPVIMQNAARMVVCVVGGVPPFLPCTLRTRASFQHRTDLVRGMVVIRRLLLSTRGRNECFFPSGFRGGYCRSGGAGTHRRGLSMAAVLEFHPRGHRPSLPGVASVGRMGF